MDDGGQQSDGAPVSGARVPIILVCSTSDVELADGAATGLRNRGFDVAVMGAAEDGSSRLSDVVERFERQGLYVLCRGGELDRDGVDGLRSMLRNHDVPFGRTLTLATNQGGARGLEERVVSVARRMVTGRFERTDMKIRPDGDAESSGLSPTPLLRPEDAPPSAEVVEAGDVDRWADSLAGGVAPQLDIPEDLPTAVVGTPSEPAPGPEATDPGLLTDPSVPATSDDDYVRVDKTMVTRHPDPSLIEREESSAPATTPASLPPDDDDISASEFSSGPNLKLIVGIGGIALVLIIVLAIAFSGSEDPEPSSSDEVAVRDDAEGSKKDETPAANEEPKADEPSTDEPKADEPEAAEDGAPVDEPEPAKADGGEEPEPAKAEDEPEPAVAEDEPEPVAEPEPDLEGAEKALAHRSSVDLALLDESPLPPAAPEDRAAIALALEEREIRSWNAFLLAGDDAGEMNFEAAESFCRSLSAGGISGWRLPSIGELLSLSGAKMLDRKGIFWSETPGDAFGDTRIVVNAKKGSTSPVTVGWDGARPICIRVRE